MRTIKVVYDSGDVATFDVTLINAFGGFVSDIDIVCGDTAIH